jgi:FtsP/CotA-like multicopper oxidase with cupredoxin domain
MDTYRPRLRRWFVGFLSLLVIVPAVALAAAGASWLQRPVDNTSSLGFDTPLAIPPLADSRIEDGRRVFDLTVEEGVTDFGIGDGATPTWGFNGAYLGPTLRAERGEEVQVNVTNELRETTSVHWHGHHLPAAMDGGPHQEVEPGETWTPHWEIDQPAATTWYHPHPHGETADHVYRGLAGMFILDDPESSSLSLPSEYGVDDVPLIVQDKSFDSRGRLDDSEPMFSQVGFLGDTIVTNGTVGAYHDVTTDLVRLRLLNGSNGRSYNFGFEDDRGFELIATDGGLLPTPHATDRVRLSPGERAEIVVPMNPGESALLRSYPVDLGTDFWNQSFSGGDDSFDVLLLKAADSLDTSAELPERLAALPDLDPGEAVRTRTFRLGGSNINGLKMEMDRIDEVVEVDTTEIWEITNPGSTPHNFHVHDVQFAVVDIDGEAPGPALIGWKDTVYAEPGTTTRLVIRFKDYTDPDTPYMLHCHFLRHEDRGMMLQFVVVEPGQQAGEPPAGHEH